MDTLRFMLARPRYWFAFLLCLSPILLLLLPRAT